MPPSQALIERLEARGRYPRWVLWAALAGMFATTFPITILTVSLELIAREFETSETTVAWVISAPMLLSAVALPLLGKLGDLHGHRRVFLAGFAAATITAGLTALAWDAPSLIALRTLAAVVGGSTMPTSMALIFNVTQPEERVRAMGWWSMTTAAAPALGLIAGGPLVDLLGWRVVFVGQALLSLLALGLATLVLRETPRQRVGFDVAGALSLALGVAGFMLALGLLRDVSTASPGMLGVLGASLAGGVGLVAFVGIERRAAAPLLPLEFFANRGFSSAIASNAFMGAAYMGAFVLAPLMLLQRFEFSISLAAATMLLRTVTLTAASPVGGWLGGRVGERGAAVVGCGVMTVSLLVLAGAVVAHSIVLVGLGFVLQGMGHGLGLPSLTAAVTHAVPDQDLGIASAFNRLTYQVGSAFGITLLTLIYGWGNAAAGPGAETAALDLVFAHGFLAGAALSGLSLLAAFGLGGEPSGRRQGERLHGTL